MCRFLHTFIRYEVFLSNTNNFQTELFHTYVEFQQILLTWIRVDLRVMKRYPTLLRVPELKPLSYRCPLLWLLVASCLHLLLAFTISFYFFFVNRVISLMCRVFAYGPVERGSSPGRVIPKTQKKVLDAALLNTQHYKVRIKDPYTFGW